MRAFLRGLCCGLVGALGVETRPALRFWLRTGVVGTGTGPVAFRGLLSGCRDLASETLLSSALSSIDFEGPQAI